MAKITENVNLNDLTRYNADSGRRREIGVFDSYADFIVEGGPEAYGKGPLTITGQPFYCDGAGVTLTNGAVGIVATRCAINHEQVAGVWYTDGCSLHQATTNITRLKPLHGNWQSSHGVGNDTNNTGPMTIECAIEYPAGTITRVTYAGVNSTTVAAGATTDPDWCNVTIPKGAFFGVRHYATFSNGLVYHSEALNAGMDGIYQGATNSGTPITNNIMNGGYSYSGRGGGFIACCAILGDTASRSYLLIGDSLTYGASPSTAFKDTFDSQYRYGMVERSIPDNCGFINCGVAGTVASNPVVNYAKRFALAQYCTDIVFFYGNNDWAGGTAAATTIANVNGILNTYASGKRILLPTMPPRVTGTFTTIVGQTLHANEAIRIAYNNLLLTTGVTKNAKVIDLASVAQSAYDAGTWKVFATAQAATGDGTHPNQQMCKYVGANLYGAMI